MDEPSPNEERAVILQHIAAALNGAKAFNQTGVLVVERYDIDGDTVIVRAYPDDTKKDAPQRFAVTVKHQLS